MEYFQEGFEPHLVVHSPGRINIIGEHTDYNMGYVLPAAIDKGIIFRFRKNNSENQCRIQSNGYSDLLYININAIVKSNEAWHNYLLGVLHEIRLRTNKIKGFDCTIESDLPTGSGVSSSAALECGLAYGLNELFGLGLSKLEIVKFSQMAEHNFVGTKCGIMDQFASVMSMDQHLLLLDCRNLEHTHIPIKMDPYKIIMLNSKVTHNLASSEYNIRKQECEEGVAIIRKTYPEVTSLRDVTKDMLQHCKQGMNATLFKRCLFVVEENIRVLKTVEALKQHNWKKVGALLYKGHEGISKQYEVSCAETDFLVAFSKKNKFVLGARQTGGGFGGCTLNIVHKDAVKTFVDSASEAYFAMFGIHLDAFEALPSRGTTVIKS
jgi:galactokinase